MADSSERKRQRARFPRYNNFCDALLFLVSIYFLDSRRGTDFDHRAAMDGRDDVAVQSPSSGVLCSICIEVVADDGSRSRAKLRCGHEFHLDCIGSAFNMKGAMQCPNCRKIENGQWLHANDHSVPENSSVEEIIGNFGNQIDPDVPFNGHWCPFGITGFGSPFQGLEFPSTTYHDHGDRAAGSSVPPLHAGYAGLIPPAISRSTSGINESYFNHHWSCPFRHNEMFDHHAFPTNMQNHGWGHQSSPLCLTDRHINSASPAPLPLASAYSHGEHIYNFWSDPRVSIPVTRQGGLPTTEPAIEPTPIEAEENGDFCVFHHPCASASSSENVREVGRDLYFDIWSRE